MHIQPTTAALLGQKHCTDWVLLRFRWASCQLDAISRVRTPKEVRKALASLPTGLEDTYKRILSDTFREDAELLRKMLMWLSFCTTRLTREELREALAIQPHASEIDEDAQLTSVEDLLGLGNSLVNISQRGKGVELAHLSVRDYLLSGSLAGDSRASYFALVPERSHAELAADCLTYLFFKELASGPCRSGDDYMERLRRMPLLKYAANAWSYHLRAAKPDEELSALVLRLFLPESHDVFMSWLQVIHTGTDSNFKWDIYPRHATPLYYAASFGLRDVVKYFLDTGMEPKNLDAPGSRFGGTALHAAAIREHLEVMEDLLKAGADPSKADFDKVTPLHSVASQGSVEATRILLRFGAATDAKDSMTNTTPLEWARQSGRVSVAILLEAASSTFSASDSSGSTMTSSGQSTPWFSTISSNRSESTAVSEAAKDEIMVWKPVAQFFPDHYEQRSGLSSSVILSFAIGDDLTTLHSTLESAIAAKPGDDGERQW